MLDKNSPIIYIKKKNTKKPNKKTPQKVPNQKYSQTFRMFEFKYKHKGR